MTLPQASFHPIPVDPLIVQDLELIGEAGGWYDDWKDWLIDEVADGQITYDEGLTAGYGLWRLQKILQGNTDLKNQYVRTGAALDSLADRLVTIVDPKKQILRVHGMEIQVEGKDIDPDRLIAIGEGIRRHSPEQVSDLFDPTQGQLRIRIYYGPFITWPDAAATSYPSTDHEILIKILIDNCLIPLCAGYTDTFPSQAMVFLRSSPWFTDQLLSELTEHELGHLVIGMYTFYNSAYAEGGCREDPRVGYGHNSPKWLVPLQVAYDRKLLEAYLSERVGEFEKALRDEDRELIKTLKEEALEKVRWYRWRPWRTNTAVTEHRLNNYSFTDFGEFFCEAARVYNNPDTRDVLWRHSPVWSTYFSVLQTLSVAETQDPFFRQNMTAIIRDPADPPVILPAPSAARVLPSGI